LKNCKVELHETKAVAGKTTTKKKTAATFAAEAVFSGMGKQITPAMAKKVGAVFRFDVTKGNIRRSWIVDLTGKGSVTEIPHDDKTIEAGCTIEMSDTDLVKMLSGKLDAQAAFMEGKLNISGDMMLATKLSVLRTSKAAL